MNQGSSQVPPISQPCGGHRDPARGCGASALSHGGHHGTRHCRLLHHWLGHQPSGRPGARPLTGSTLACGNPRRPETFLLRGFRPAGLSWACIEPGNSCGVRSTRPVRSVAMIYVILSMCVFSGIVISRPIVRAMGLR